MNDYLIEIPKEKEEYNIINALLADYLSQDDTIHKSHSNNHVEIDWSLNVRQYDEGSWVLIDDMCGI